MMELNMKKLLVSQNLQQTKTNKLNLCILKGKGCDKDFYEI